MQTRRIDAPTARTLDDDDEPEPFFASRNKEEQRKDDYRDHTDEMARMFASNATPVATKPPPNDRVLYVGVNTAKADGKTAQNDREWDNLRAMRPDAERIQASNGSVRDGFDLSKKEGIAGFVKTLKIPQAKADAVASVLERASIEGRDELAGIAKVLARGENGESIPSRWILSGHYGDRISDGASPNGFETSDVRALAKALPIGASQVEDIMISGCYSGGKTQLESFKEAFPSLRSSWGYGVQGGHAQADQSPTGANAVAHIAEWEKETRGRGTPIHARDALQHVVGGSNISYWDGTYHGRRP